MNQATNLGHDQLTQFYRQMLTIRRFEEAASQLYMEGVIRGFLHLYIGEEAVAVGSISALKSQDYVITHYRDHGHALARGLDPKAIMAELCGKATGTSGGKAGSMHIFDAHRRFVGGHAIVGGQLPIAIGLALAIKYKREDGVVMCFFGDGAANEGVFQESLNLASLWKLPVIFFLENNLYGMGSHIAETNAGGSELYTLAEPFKIPAGQVDGMDVLEVHKTSQEAIARVRSTEGPVLIEAMTYRFKGHSMADPVAYRNNLEVNRWLLKDPIQSFKSYIRSEIGVPDTKVTQIEQNVSQTIKAAVNFAKGSLEPSLDSLWDNVYA